jgi:hypothetical protein
LTILPIFVSFWPPGAEKRDERKLEMLVRRAAWPSNARLQGRRLNFCETAPGTPGDESLTVGNSSLRERRKEAPADVPRPAE